MLTRNKCAELLKRIQEPRRFIQVLSGPRQTGKTTLAQQVLESLSIPHQYASADDPSLQSETWIEQQWDIARLLLKKSDASSSALLVLDEVQKIPNWSGWVKRLWDEDTHKNIPLKVMILGSAPLLIQKGLTESLAGRFELLPIPHWSYAEMKASFGWDLESFIYFGGYPASSSLIKDESRWTRYILDSLVETSLSRDVLLLNRIDKPVLLRRLFHLGAGYSGQILSYQKMLGQLKDAGNTTTLAHYLELLAGAGMLMGIQKFSGSRVRQRASSPKFQAMNNALMTVANNTTFEEAKKNRDYWGRLVESAAGAHLVNQMMGTTAEIYYWREGILEVDFIIRRGKNVMAIEVKSGRHRESHPGLEAFLKIFKPDQKILVGGSGMSLEQFFLSNPVDWFS